MVSEVFSNISKIIERDSKSTTYKFALLRGVIDIVRDNSPFIQVKDDRVYFPMGLLIEKWILYYYPILESKVYIPQINGEANLAFRSQLTEFIDCYKSVGGISSFYNDLKNTEIPQPFQLTFMELVRKLKDTIWKMPMRYIGRSISNDYYSIFKYYPGQRPRLQKKVNQLYLIQNFGSFSIPLEYYEAFRILGSFINGQESILFKWAEFSVVASGKCLSVEKVISEVLKSPITERDVLQSKKIYKSVLDKEGKVYCVWSGRALTAYDIDHVIPFSVWRNNDLWNLLPASAIINNNKRNKIPSPDLVDKRKDLILHYWHLINQSESLRFQNEMQVSLLGENPFSEWKDIAIRQLQNSCDYLINKRGYEEWKG